MRRTPAGATGTLHGAIAAVITRTRRPLPPWTVLCVCVRVCLRVVCVCVSRLGAGGAARGAEGTGGREMAPDHGAAAATDGQRAGSKRPRGL